jgi:hypothetical protein
MAPPRQAPAANRNERGHVDEDKFMAAYRGCGEGAMK